MRVEILERTLDGWEDDPEPSAATGALEAAALAAAALLALRGLPSEGTPAALVRRLAEEGILHPALGERLLDLAAMLEERTTIRPDRVAEATRDLRALSRLVAASV
jgi:hypothetical protein